MASWQVTGRLKTGVAALAGAVVVSMVAPAVAEAAAAERDPSAPSDPTNRAATDVRAKYRTEPGSPGPADSPAQQSSSPGQSTSSSPSTGFGQAPSSQPTQRKDKPPDRGAHKFSPQQRSSANSPGSGSGFGPTTKVGADRPEDRDPNKVTPQQRTPAPDTDRRDRRGASTAPPQGIPGRSGANGSATQQLPVWVPRKPKTKAKTGTRDLAYRYRIVNGQPVDPTANPYDWGPLDDFIDDLGRYGWAYLQKLVDYGVDYYELAELVFNLRTDRWLLDPSGAYATASEVLDALQTSWEARIHQLENFAIDPAGVTQDFVEREVAELKQDPATYLGELMGASTTLVADAALGVASGGVGPAVRRGLNQGLGDALDAPRPNVDAPNRDATQQPAPAQQPNQQPAPQQPTPGPGASPGSPTPDRSTSDGSSNGTADRSDGPAEYDSTPVPAPRRADNSDRPATNDTTDRSRTDTRQGRSTSLGKASPGPGPVANRGPDSARPGDHRPGRLSQDIAARPKPPAPLSLSRSIGRPSHNQALREDLAALPRNAYDIRVNQQQVDANGRRVGINRPDLQYTVDGQRYYVEYEGLSNPRGALHQARILANDPGAIFTLRLIP